MICGYLVFPSRCTYFHGSPTKRQVIFPWISHDQWCFLSTENGFLGKLLQVAAWGVVWEVPAATALPFGVSHLKFLHLHNPFPCCVSRTAAASLTPVLGRFISLSGMKVRDCAKNKGKFSERTFHGNSSSLVSRVFFPPVYISTVFKYTTLFHYYCYCSEYWILFSYVLAVLNQIRKFLYIFFWLQL